MKKTTLLAFACGALTVWSPDSYAQVHSGVAPRFDNVNGNENFQNHHGDYVKRFFINEPASVAGQKVFTITYREGLTTGNWGRAIDSVWSNIELITVRGADNDSLACGAISNTSDLDGNWALIFRGDCEFGDKALRAQNAGAVGVLIVNNAPGGPVGMGPGAFGNDVRIPVLMVSKDDGEALNAVMNAGQTVRLSLTQWGLETQKDIGILSTGAALWNSFAIPKSQIEGGTPAAFKALSGAFIGNFGTDNVEDIVLTSEITFTPDGGSASVLKNDTITISEFLSADSIMYGFTEALVDVNATSKGKLETSYSLTFDGVDDNPGDNVLRTTSYITDSVYSKGRYDFEAGRPVTGGISYSFGQNGFSWGPLYYINKGGYSIRKAQFSISTGSGTEGSSLDGSADMILMVYELPVTGDEVSIVTEDDLVMVGVGRKRFTNADSSGHIFTVDIHDVDKPGEPLVTKDDTYYWVVAEVPEGWFLAVDGHLNYYPRFFFRSHADRTGGFFWEPFAPVLRYGQSNPDGNVYVEGFPGEYYLTGDSARYSYQVQGMVPAIPIHLSTIDMTGVKEMASEVFTAFEVYPNPASDVLNVQFSLTETAEKVYVSVVDVMGRNISREAFSSVKDQTFTIPTQGLAQGNYYVIISSDKGTMGKKFQVVKQ